MFSNFVENIKNNKENKENWKKFYNFINNLNEINNDEINNYFINLLNNNPNDEINLDILDFIFNFGSNKIISSLANENLLENSLLNLIKKETNASTEIQMKVIFLVKKWKNKFINNQDLFLFQKIYEILSNNGIFFPPEGINIQTYDKFINENELNNNLK